MKILEVLVGASARSGEPPAFVGGTAVELRQLGADVRVLTTDLAPWGWMQRQARIEPDQVHPALARSDLHIYRARFPRQLAFSPGFSSAIKAMAGDFDVVHIHNLWQFPSTRPTGPRDERERPTGEWPPKRWEFERDLEPNKIRVNARSSSISRWSSPKPAGPESEVAQRDS